MTKKVVVASASDLNRVVRIQHDVGTSDAQGGHTPNWVDIPGLSHVPAQIETWKGGQHFTNDQLFSNLFTKITVRYRASAPINATMRLVYGVRVFLIRNVQNLHEQSKTIELICEELQAKGSTH